MIFNNVGGYNVDIKSTGATASSGSRQEGYGPTSFQHFMLTIGKDGKQHQLELVFDEIEAKFRLGRQSTNFMPVSFDPLPGSMVKIQGL